ncbi:unnamed protein product [Didymodactylos carnosus]|uniref:Uncharacterized protein n=1 Tax=Didymodactylos carnosus TaxID=1234261 RepID=A0A814KA66_9BILA|nr:unnamed protein product [Didymodactylos carnosus]CAF1149990.1 unnamed protein product [Didymodactylos carnosus]CAF3816440.1 unnamed protein product [Didymodactylos carnosus]CAF3955508.1 unnamed protein product [Didymodactylos carnosus]
MQPNSPWNYGNYFMGNTTMQMMPFMMKKVGKYLQSGAGMGMFPFGGNSMMGMPFGGMMSSFGGFPMMGGGSMGFSGMGFSGGINCGMGSSPFMMAATPLPIAFNPIVQGVYPTPSMSPVQMWNPMQFMSALSAGPMPYRPPALDFPSNVGMVMSVPFGTPNPFLSSPFGSYNACGGCYPCCCLPPPVLSYPRPVMVPQPYPVPYAQPVEIPHIKPVPIPRAVTNIAPPVMLGQGGFPQGGFSMPSSMIPAGQPMPSLPFNNVLSAPPITPLMPAGASGVFSGYGQPLVSSAAPSQQQRLLSEQKKPGAHNLPIYNIDSSREAQQLAFSLSTLGTSSRNRKGITPSKAKNQNMYNRSRQSFPTYSTLTSTKTNNNRSEPTIPLPQKGILISDSGWMPNVSARKKRIPSFQFSKYRRNKLYKRRKHSTVDNEYDCEICKSERDRQRLKNYFGSSKLSSLLSSPRKSHKQHGSNLALSISSSHIASDASRLKKGRHHRSEKTHHQTRRSQGTPLNRKDHDNQFHQQNEEEKRSRTNSKNSSQSSTKQPQTRSNNDDSNKDNESSKNSVISTK